MGFETAEPKLTLKRWVAAGKAVSRTLCPSGQITVLSDESGAALPEYTRALSGTDQSGTVQLEMSNSPAGNSAVVSVGFSDSFPADKKIREYLLEHGCPESSYEQILVDYDLVRFQHLPCSHLPQLPARQILLLGALYGDAAVIALNDPFLPFNGRWREDFAKLILDDCERTQRTVVVTNLSFVPTQWTRSTRLTSVDVAWNEENALREYQGETERQNRQMERELKRQEKMESQPLSKRKPVFELPENMTFAYRQTTDWLFAPLEQISTFVRSYSGAVAAGSFCVLVLLMGFVMFPNMGAYRTKLSRLAQENNYTMLGQLFSNGENLPAPPVMENLVDRIEELESPVAAVDLPVSEIVAETPPVILACSKFQSCMVETDAGGDGEIPVMLKLLVEGDFATAAEGALQSFPHPDSHLDKGTL